MADRETLLNALHTALKTIAQDEESLQTDAVPFPQENVQRNPPDDLPDGVRPALRLYDGDEIPGDKPPRPAKSKPPVAKKMQVEIRGFLSADQAVSTTAVNTLIKRVRRILYNNATWLAALGANDTITETDLKTVFNAGEKVEGAFILFLDIAYEFTPESL